MTDEPFDWMADYRAHVQAVRKHMRVIFEAIEDRALIHDASKLSPEERPIFEEYTPRLKTTVFGSDEYRAQLAAMGPALAHHYEANRHHPEHFPNGVDGMTLVDLIEMVCDWRGAAERQGRSVDLPALMARFKIDPQLGQIIRNTLDAY